MPVEVELMGEVGSVAHGLGTPESDHDYMGVYLETPESLLGIGHDNGTVRYRSRGEGEKSRPGDSDHVYYPLRKYVALAAQGNPTVLTLLYTQTMIVPDTIGLRERRNLFLSKWLIARHIGYSEGMVAELTGSKKPRVNRPDLIAAHGYDTKSAMHVIRLLIQAVELVSEGTMYMPMKKENRELLMAIRRGEVSKDESMAFIEHFRARLTEAENTTSLPSEPDYAAINAWLIRVYAERFEFEGHRVWVQ